MKKICYLLRRKLLCLLASAGLTRSFRERTRLIDFLLREAISHTQAKSDWLAYLKLQDCLAEMRALKR